MSDFDRLPPDQHAVLSLLLERGKSYSEVADMLAIPESAVRERAHAALDALANEPAGGRRSAFLGDAGSAEDSRRAGTPRRAGVGTAAGQSQPDASRSRATAPSASDTISSRQPPARSTQAGSRQPPAQSTPAGSRRGGLLLLGGIVAAIAVIAIVIAASGSKGSNPTATTTTSASSTTSKTGSTSASSATKPKLDKTIALTAGEPELKASGMAYVLSEGSRRAFYVAAQGLPPSSGFFYAVWLYNSPSNSTPLGKAPTVASNGRMEGGGPLPTNAGSYSKLIITRETSSAPKEPGPIVLTGNFALH